MRKLTTGFYVPTESFKNIPEHIAVMFEDNQTLVAICGAVDDDPEHITESIEYARKFAAVDDLLAALKNARIALTFYRNWMKTHNCDPDYSTEYPFGIEAEEAARAAIEKSKRRKS